MRIRNSDNRGKERRITIKRLIKDRYMWRKKIKYRKVNRFR